MAEVDGIVKFELDQKLRMSVFSCDLTATGDSTISATTHKMGNSITVAIVTVRGSNTTTHTVSGTTITVNGTADDTVDVIVYGR